VYQPMVYMCVFSNVSANGVHVCFSKCISQWCTYVYFQMYQPTVYMCVFLSVSANGVHVFFFKQMYLLQNHLFYVNSFPIKVIL